MPAVLAVSACPYCGADVVRVTVQGTIRSVDAFPNPSGTLELDLAANRAWPTKQDGPSFSGTRHHLHRDTCPGWAGPVGG